MSTFHSRSTAAVPRAIDLPGRRRSYRAARAFYLTLFLGACFAAYSVLQQLSNLPTVSSPHGLYSRDVTNATLNDDEECRLVHRANDQCAFIKKHCPDDEAGFAAYLDLFYCRLPHAKPVSFIILVSWLGLLFSTIGIAASDFFCINLSTIASILGMSESMAGVTFLAFGNGSPDVFSTFAAMSTDSGSLAVGELFGAAGFITAVVAGSMALIRPFHVARKSFIRDVVFFAVAAAFSIYFLWDGRLHLWECIVMVVFYVFYVAFVVAWHWWIGRRRRGREKEAAARGHFVAPGDELDVEQERYRDDPEEAEERRSSNSRGVSREDWSALERGSTGISGNDGNEDDEEEARDRWMSELSSNMRLTRPGRSRRNTLNPVRPSLVGALEFQAVFKSLQKSQNIQTIPLYARRYSDDPTFTTAQQQDQMSTVSDPASRPPYQVTTTDNGSPTIERRHLSVPKSAPVRTRAVSANDAASLHIDPDLRQPSHAQTQADDLINIANDDVEGTKASSLRDVSSRSHASHPQSPSVQLLPASPNDRPVAPVRTNTSKSHGSTDRLSPSERAGIFHHASTHVAQRPPHASSMDNGRNLPSAVPSARSLPRIKIPREERSRTSTPTTSPFPRFRDDPTPPGTRPPSLHLPPSIASPESIPASQSAEQEAPKRPMRWWPYTLMPPPGVIVSTLFPTIYHWPEKTWWEKFLGVVAAPSVLLLTITLPVVENDNDSEAVPTPQKDNSLESARSKSVSGAPGQSAAGLKGVSRDEATEDHHPGTHRHSLAPNGATGLGTTATVATHAEQQERHNYGANALEPPSIILDQPDVLASPMPYAGDEQPTPELWNRWLTIVQLFLAPLLVVFSIYSQAAVGLSPKWLIKPILICLLISVVLLIPILLTTTPTHRPVAYRTILSLCGFVVSIAWISTIAAQVVGALKALAVILNMSHAIMGLTIFAVGNSLGDLVADVTVAKLGYPVMALSACFGGPMLNILLGIGLSGSYILIRGAEHRHARHPDKGLKYKTYHIEVSNTLLVSGATLLVTLLGLLIAVPLNKWVLSRKIGWALIALWTLSTIGNVVLEVTGWAES